MRMRNSSSNGSKCKSLACSLIAISSTMFSSLRTGALSARAVDVVQVDRAVGADAGGGGGQLGVVLQRRDDALDALGALAVVALERRGHRRLGRHDDADVEAQERPQLVLHAQVLRIAHGDGERVAVELDGDDAIHLGHRRGDHRQHVGLDREVAERDRVQRQLLGQRLGELIVVDQAHVDGHFAQQLAGVLVLLIDQQLLLLVGDETQVDQDLSDAAMGHVRRSQRLRVE